MMLTPLQLILPLGGFIVLGIFARALPRTIAAAVGCVTVLASFSVAISNFIMVQRNGLSINQTLWTWVVSGNLHIDFNITVDQLSAIMMLVVTGVGFLILVYSHGYMDGELSRDPDGDAAFVRFFAFMNLFIFAMSLLVVAGNFLFLLVGWAGVGLASFLLIGFWYQRPSAVAAAQKAFVINVIGDFGLMIAIFLIAMHFHSLNYFDVLSAPAGGLNALQGTFTPIALMLLIAAAAKSAQLPLHIWLPDAMEGPTPVSALIHAATMVTAGVYLVARTHVIFEAAPAALTVLAVMGGASALYAATVALFQYDIKRVLAYSTMSQLGYMFMAESVGADSAAIFHLTTHAFFKALLFMSAGAVIHALHGEQDIRKMGGLRSSQPLAYWSFIVGGLALSGIPIFSGFWSKDGILSAILDTAQRTNSFGDYALWGVGLLTALLTGLYSFRLIYAVFLGSRQGETGARAGHEAAHATPQTMAIPMVVLGVLTVIGGFEGTPINNAFGAFLSPVLGEAIEPSGGLLWSSIILSVAAGGIGIAIAWARYGARQARFTTNRNPIYLLFTNAYYLDQIYDAVITRPVLALGRGLTVLVEQWTLDGGTRGVAWLVGQTSTGLRKFQSGYARNYALGILVGAVLIVVALLINNTMH